MKSSVKTLEPTKVELTVEVPFEELEPSMKHAYKHIGEQITVPGFRKGKVPARIIDQRVGRGAVIEHAVNEALPGFYSDAAREHELEPMGRPEVDLREVPADNTGQLVFAITVEVRPQFDLPDLAGLTVETLSSDITDDDVEERLTSLRERFGTLVTVERAAKDGDFVVLDLNAQQGGEEIDAVSGISYQIGTGNMIEGLDEALVGMSAGETKQFGAPLAGGEHAGEDAQVTVTLTSVKERNLPEPDDDFAQLASEFDTMDELRADLREQVASSRQANQAMRAQQALLDLLLEQTDIPVPAGVLAAEVDEHLEREGRQDDEEHRVEATDEATTQIRTQLLLDKLARELSVGVTQDDLVQFMVRTAAQYGLQPQEFIEMADQSGQLPTFISEVARSKALVEALRRVQVVDAEGTALDMIAILGTGEPVTTPDAAGQDEGDQVVVLGDLGDAPTESDEASDEAIDQDSQGADEAKK